MGLLPEDGGKAICQVVTADKNKRLVHSWQAMDMLDSMSNALSQLLNLTDSQANLKWVCYCVMQHFLHT